MLALYFLLAQIALIGGITLFEKRLNPGPLDWIRNIQAWIISFLTGMLFLVFVPDWTGGALIDAKELPYWAGFLIFLFVRDGVEYAFHYAQHRVPFLWRMHSLHHSDPEMCALTTNRHFWGDQFIKSFTIWPLSFMIIEPTHAVLVGYAAVSLYNYFIHANLKVDFGRFSWVLNSPAYHRRHHSKLPEHFDSNFAALFPVFDVIFGTYRRPDGWPPTGQATAPRSLRELLSWPHYEGRVDEPEAEPATAEPLKAAA